MAKNAENIFVKNVVRRFGGIFQKTPKIKIWGPVQNLKTRFGKKWWASMALGQSIIAKKKFGDFRGIAKTNFPEIPFPPPGGNQFPAKSEKWPLL